MKALHTLVAIVLLLLASAAAIAALDGCNQEPIPIHAMPGFKCGVGAYFECPSGGCCLGYTEVCGQVGHACNEHECCFVGEGPTFGVSRDGGPREREQLTPDQVRRSEGR